MSPQVHRLFLTALLFAFLNNPALAQQPEQTPKPDETKATELLHSIAERVPSLRSANNRVIIGSTVADLLWERDEKQSRALFASIAKDLSEAIANLDFSEQEDVNIFSYLQQQRQRLIETVARRDPALALDFLKATRPEVASGKSGNFVEQERALELALATSVASRDPGFALKIARASLARGISFNQVSVLVQVQQKDPAAAQAFFTEIVDRLASDEMQENAEAFSVGWNLLSTFQPPQASEESFRRLIDTLSNRVLSLNLTDASRIQLSQSIYHQMRSAIQTLERFAPGRAQSLRDWTRMVERTFDPNTRMYAELNELSQEGSIDDVLALTSRYPEELHLQIQHLAIWKAVNSGELDRARQMTKEMIKDPLQREQMMNQIDNNLAWRSTNEGPVGEARRLWSKIKQPEQRIQIMTQLATNLANKGDKKAALDILIEARSFLENMPQSGPQLNAQLQLIRGFCAIAPGEAETMLQPFIARLNQIIAAAVVLDGVDNRYLQDGEWVLQNYYNINGLVNQLDQALGQLAQAEKHFSTARHLADQLERPEIRLNAQLIIVQSVLGNGNPNQPVPNVRITQPRRIVSLN